MPACLPTRPPACPATMQIPPCAPRRLKAAPRLRWALRRQQLLLLRPLPALQVVEEGWRGGGRREASRQFTFQSKPKGVHVMLVRACAVPRERCRPGVPHARAFASPATRTTMAVASRRNSDCRGARRWTGVVRCRGQAVRPVGAAGCPRTHPMPSSPPLPTRLMSDAPTTMLPEGRNTVLFSKSICKEGIAGQGKGRVRGRPTSVRGTAKAASLLHPAAPSAEQQQQQQQLESPPAPSRPCLTNAPAWSAWVGGATGGATGGAAAPAAPCTDGQAREQRGGEGRCGVQRRPLPTEVLLPVSARGHVTCARPGAGMADQAAANLSHHFARPPTVLSSSSSSCTASPIATIQHTESVAAAAAAALPLAAARCGGSGCRAGCAVEPRSSGM